eukprot:CAMPEP_0170066120 /NCGR_PEP_ID=MMETSP0019_2-20121128/5932_1 /TAXON_ID=98059 /ORGANISM="Dinobryon sp., Strain UTEXLB2267" /LENGTH=76 /DNA_ID=CAMNT_0010273121 /DNA_START=367 /DNA_END=597 /DNA_ORIENTATION=-
MTSNLLMISLFVADVGNEAAAVGHNRIPSEQITQLRNETMDQFFKLYDENHVKVESPKRTLATVKLFKKALSKHIR